MSITVRELIATLQGMDPDAQVEFEVPKKRSADRESIDGARVMVESVEETFYNTPSNKWVVLS